jgi:hypothetical protein
MTLDSALEVLEVTLRTTPVGRFVRTSQFAWPILESLHFMGMSVLIGTIGLFDLRLLGFARGIPYAALHRLIPLGISAYTLNILTGLCFLSGTPDQYLWNPAFRFKVAFMAVAGLNVVFFYTRVFKRLQELPPDSAPPFGARVAGAVSLTMWIGVMSAGRLLTFFRPPYV